MELDLKCLCWQLATFFDAFNASKAFHLWIIMLTYLGLVGAWVYYRNHAQEEGRDHEREEDKAEGISRSLKQESDNSHAEDELDGILTLEQGDLFDENYFAETISSCERSSQTDRIQNSDEQTETACGELSANEPIAFVKIIEDNYAANIDHSVYSEKSQNSDETPQPHDASYDSKDGMINRSVNGLIVERQSYRYSENAPGISAFDQDLTERWRAEEQGIEVGFLNNSRSTIDEDEQNYTTRLPNLVEDESHSESTCDDCETVENIGANERRTAKDDRQTQGSLTSLERRNGPATEPFEVKTPRGNFLAPRKKDQDDVLSLSSETDGSIVDLDSAGGQVANFGRFDSMVDSFEIYNFAYPPDPDGDIVIVSESEVDVETAAENESVLSKDVTEDAGAPVRNETLDPDWQGASDDSLSMNLKKSETDNSGFLNSKLDKLDSENDFAVIRTGNYQVEQGSACSSEQGCYVNKSFDDAESEESVQVDNGENAPAVAVEDCLFEVENCLDKQFARITNTAGVKRWIGLPDEATDDEREVCHEKEAGYISGGQSNLSDGYSERYKRTSEGVKELVENGRILTDLQSELPGCYSETCDDERIEINESVNIERRSDRDCDVFSEKLLQAYERPFDFCDGLSEITDGFSEYAVDSCDIGCELEELPDNASVITDLCSEFPDGYSETFDERSDVSDGDCYVSVTKAVADMLDERYSRLSANLDDNVVKEIASSNQILANDPIDSVCNFSGMTDQPHHGQAVLDESVSDSNTNKTEESERGSPVEDYCNVDSFEENDREDVINEGDDQGEALIMKNLSQCHVAAGFVKENLRKISQEEEESAKESIIKNSSLGDCFAEDNLMQDFLETNSKEGSSHEEESGVEVLEDSVNEYYAEDSLDRCNESEGHSAEDSEQGSTAECLFDKSKADLDIEKEDSETLSESEAFATCSEYEATDVDTEINPMKYDRGMIHVEENFESFFHNDSSLDSENVEAYVHATEAVFDESEGCLQTVLTAKEGLESYSGDWDGTDRESDTVCDHPGKVVPDDFDETLISRTERSEYECPMKLDYDIEREGDDAIDHKDGGHVDHEEKIKMEKIKMEESSETDTSESTGSLQEIDYKILVSSGEESDEIDRDIDYCQDLFEASYDLTSEVCRTKRTALKPITEEDESCIEGDIFANRQVVIKKDTVKENASVSVTFVNAAHRCYAHVSWREIDLGLSSYPKNFVFSRYFRSLLLSPGVFVDALNSLPLQLDRQKDNGSQIAKLRAEKIIPRSALNLIARESHFVKKIRQNSERVCYSNNTSRKVCERSQGSIVLLGCFGISFPKKADYCKAGVIARIVCEPRSAQDAGSVYDNKNSSFSTGSLVPAVTVEGSSEFDNDESEKTAATSAWNCNRSGSEYILFTELASVERESLCGSSVSRASPDEYLEGEASRCLNVDELECRTEDPASLADETANRDELRRFSADEWGEGFETRRTRSSSNSSFDSVSPSNSHVIFERNCESSDDNDHFDEFLSANEELPEVDDGLRTAPDKLDFDVLLSKTVPLPGVNTDISDTYYPKLFHQDFEDKAEILSAETENLEGTNFNLEDPRQILSSGMGQAQSVVLTKGTLAMPVSNYSLRGISVRNQGEYAVINYKNTRFAPLISVDRRIEIAMQVPRQNEQNEVKPDEKPGFHSLQKVVANDAQDGVVDEKLNDSVNFEVLTEMTKRSGSIEIDVREPGDTSSNRKSISESLNDVNVETVPYSEVSDLLLNRVDRIAEIAQKYCETLDEKAARLADDGKSDETSEELIAFKTCGEDTLVELIDVETVAFVESGCSGTALNPECMNNTEKEEDDNRANVCATTYPDGCANTVSWNPSDSETAISAARFADIGVSEAQYNALKDITSEVSPQIIVSESSFEQSYLSNSADSAVKDVGSSRYAPPEIADPGFKDTGIPCSINDATKAYASYPDLKAVACDSCFDDTGVTNPDIGLKLIQYANNNDFQVAVNQNGELSAIDNTHENAVLDYGTNYEGEQRQKPQQVDFDVCGPEIGIDSVDSEFEAIRDSENSVEHVHTKLRSKSLSSLPEGLFENMSWFYRNRPSSACFDDKSDKFTTSGHGALRRTKSAEISRKKPKITMSTNFERRPIKETNLDDLMKSLEYLGPRKRADLASEQNSSVSTRNNAEKGIAFGSGACNETDERVVADIRKAKSTTMLVSKGRYGDRKENESVARLVKKFETSATKTRKIIVETKRVYKQEPGLRNARSMDIGKNLKHSYMPTKSVGSLDENNNNRTIEYERDLANSNKFVEEPNALAVDEAETQLSNTKDKLNCDQNTKLKNKASKSSIREGIVDASPPKVYNEQMRSNAINGVVKGLHFNTIEEQIKASSDSRDKVALRSLKTEINKAERRTSEQTTPVNEEEPKRSSIYGFTVFLSENHLSDASDLNVERENENSALLGVSDEDYWMRENDLGRRDTKERLNKKVSDIDLVLNKTFQASVESLDGLEDDVSKSPCNGCGEDIDEKPKSPPGRCSDCSEKGKLPTQKSAEKSFVRSLRAKNSFRKDRRLRKWLEERQSSLSAEDKALLDDMDVEDQSKLLQKVALSKGIDLKDHGEDDMKQKRYSSLHSRHFDFLEQLRYLINFEDDDYDDYMNKLEVNEKEQDAIELLREYETSRQLKRGKSPFTSDDEGNDSDAFTDITETTFSDYMRSRHSLNSLFLSQGSLYKSKSFDIEEEDDIDSSIEKEAHFNVTRESPEKVVRSPLVEKYAINERKLKQNLVKEGQNDEVSRNEVSRNEVSLCNVPQEQEINESVEKVVATDLFSMEDVNGLINQASSALNNRRGRAARNSVPRSTTSFHPKAPVSVQEPQVRSDDVFVNHSESVKRYIGETSYSPHTKGNFKAKNFTEEFIYADSPCSLVMERLNDSSYANLRVKLVTRPSTEATVSSPPPQRHQSSEIDTGSPAPSSEWKSSAPSPKQNELPSYLIRKLKNSPQQRRRAASLREISTEDKVSPAHHAALRSVVTSPPRYVRDAPFRKSTGSYDGRRKECRSLPDLISKPEDSLVSTPLKLSRYPSGGSSTLSLQKRSPRVPRASTRQAALSITRSLPIGSPIQPPIRSPVSSPFRSPSRSPFRSSFRSPGMSDFEDDFADNETVFSDQTALLSDSSLDIGMAQDGYEIDDEDFFLPNSLGDSKLFTGFDDFMAHDSDGGSSGEYFVPLNTISKRPESRIISCAFGPCKRKDVVDWSQRSQFTSCVSCFTYYCSKECRKSHWKEHKLTCYYGRINYYTKALLRRFETNSKINERLSRLALEGFQGEGRGCVLITFSSPMAAKFFLVSGTNVFVKDPAYATLNEVMSGGIITKHQVLLQQTMQDYNPEYEFVTNLTVFVGKQNQIMSSSRSRFNTSALLRCSKIPLNRIFLSSDCETPYPDTSYDIKVFYLPRSKKHHFINETEARRYYCREVSYGLRKYGVFLKRDHPEAYDTLCLYVEHNVEFVPITLYGQANGSNYKCVVFPEGFSGSSGTLELQGRGMLV